MLIVANSQAHLDRAETRAIDSIYDIPDLLSPHFTGRHDELNQIRRAFDSNDSSSSRPTRCVIYGMAGAGKTQLALKYAELVYHERQYPFIFWVSGAWVDKLNNGFSKLFNLIDGKERAGLDQSTKCTAAQTWLEDNESQTKRRWLLIVDNANQETVELIREMLPRNNSNGKIVCTTRTEQVAQSLATAFGEQHPCISLDTPSTDDAVALFLSAAGIERGALDAGDLQKVEEIVKTVGRLPLAVDQAASFTKESRHGILGTLDVYISEQVEEVC